MTSRNETKFRIGAEVVDRVLRRPPIVELALDLELENRDSEPRWFLLPDLLDPSAPPAGETGCNGVEILALDGAGGALAPRFLGSAGFRALLVEARSTLLLRRFPFSLWDEEPAESVGLEVRIASGLRVGGRPVADWLGQAPTQPLRGEVDGARASILSTWTSPGLRAVEVEIDEVGRVSQPLRPS